MGGGVAKLVHKFIYSDQADAVLHRCPRWQRRAFRRAIQTKGMSVIRRYRNVRRPLDSENLGQVVLQWVFIHLQGYVAFINAIGAKVFIIAIYGKDDQEKRPFIRQIFELLPRASSSRVARIIEATQFLGQARTSILLVIYSIVGKRSRRHLFPPLEDLDGIPFPADVGVLQ